MKNQLAILLAIMFVALFSCHHKQQPEPVDKEAVKKEITAVLDKVYAFFDNHEIEPYAALLCDDGLFTGTDRTEFWDKKSLLKIQKEMVNDPDFIFTFKPGKRAIRVADDGKSALVVDQIEATSVFGPNLPVRITSLILKTDNGWKVNYLGWGLIPDNEDLGKIVAALAE